MKLHPSLYLALFYLGATPGVTSAILGGNNPDAQRFFKKIGANVGQQAKVVGQQAKVVGEQAKVVAQQVKVGQQAEAIKTVAQVATAAVDKKIKTLKSEAPGKAFQLVDQAIDKLMAEYDKHSGATIDQYFIDAGFANSSGTTSTCEKRDCRRRYFFNEALRWVKQGLTDIGVFIHENPTATVALFIGASALVTMMITSGELVPLALRAVGFGAKGPIARSFAAAIQSRIGNVQVGSVFAQLQSAAMGGTAMAVLRQTATVAFVGLGIAGATGGLIGIGSKTLGLETGFKTVEWKSWEENSRIDSTPELVDKMLHNWGPLTGEACVAYGYREYRAPLSLVPEGMDPLSACSHASAAIEGTGFKTPFSCVEEGHKKEVIGTWYTQSNETRCLPHWSDFEDEGCMQFGTRRMFARLVGVHLKDDWNSICETTPAQVGDQYFDTPAYCEDKGMLGIYGIFDLPDKRCECYCNGV